jgi:hypothetical protein
VSGARVGDEAGIAVALAAQVLEQTDEARVQLT